MKPRLSHPHFVCVCSVRWSGYRGKRRAARGEMVLTERVTNGEWLVGKNFVDALKAPACISRSHAVEVLIQEAMRIQAEG